VNFTHLRASMMLGFLGVRGGEDGSSLRSAHSMLKACIFSETWRVSLSSSGREGSSSGNSKEQFSMSRVQREACGCLL